MRSKEEANDYRYFPEPDLTPLVPVQSLLTAAAEGVGPMPAERRRRLAGLFTAGAELATRRDGSTDQVVTVVDLGLDELVHGAVAAGADARLALARTANEAATNPEAAKRLDPEAFAALLKMESSGQLSATQSKEVLAELMSKGGDPAADRPAARLRADGGNGARGDGRRGDRRPPAGMAALSATVTTRWRSSSSARS